MYKWYARNFIQYFILLLLINWGCYSLSTFQTPEVLEKGKTSGGFGVSAYWDERSSEISLYEVDLFFRLGIVNSLDGGLKISGIPALGGGIQVDLKYQLLKDPFFIALDLAGFYALGPSFRSSDEWAHTYGCIPMIMIGTESIYVGIKNISGFHGRGIKIGSSTKLDEENLTGIVLGLSLGESFQIIPELNYYFNDDNPLVIFGIGLQF